jgi:hypothetical protein
MAAVLDTRLRQAQTEKMAPIDLVSALVADELRRRQVRLLERRHKLARFRDPERALDTFDFDFNKKMNRALVYELATATKPPLPRCSSKCRCSTDNTATAGMARTIPAIQGRSVGGAAAPRQGERRFLCGVTQ